MTESKRCNRCKKEMPLSEFYSDSNKRDGLSTICIQCRTKKQNEYRRTSLGKYKRYANDAKRKGLEFAISLGQFTDMIHDKCSYCGKQSPDLLNRGIDRVDNKVGYTESNCVPCCSTCNMMKKTMERRDFIDHCRDVYAFQFRMTSGPNAEYEEAMSKLVDELSFSVIQCLGKE